MYTKLLIPLDGSKTAEKVLPYARFLAESLNIPAELTTVFDIAEFAGHIAPEKARDLNSIIHDGLGRSLKYLQRIATTFPMNNVKCTVETGRAEDIIIAKGDADPRALIGMATHGRSGITRWLLGSVAEKILRGASNALFLVKATERANTEGWSTVKSMIVPLDGSELAESVLPTVAGLAKKLSVRVILFRAYNLPATLYGGIDGYSVPNIDELVPELSAEARRYLEEKVLALKRLGVEQVVYDLKEGFSADEIIRVARNTPENFIAMSTHGRSGVKRWVLGSVTETVVRHSADPVLIIRGS